MTDGGSRMTPVGHPEALAIPVEDCGEPLVAVSIDTGRVSVDLSPKSVELLGYAPDFRVRTGVSHRIHEAAARLPNGYALLVKEGYRPLEVQARVFADHLEEVRDVYPGKPEDWLRLQASKFVAPPEAATHVTGASFDVTLVEGDGTERDLGTAYDAPPEQCRERCVSHADDIAPLERRHREILFSALLGAGFVNYPFEWWHRSYGDRYWAYV